MGCLQGVVMAGQEEHPDPAASLPVPAGQTESLRAAAALPLGTVTLLFTDIEGSTRLVHQLGSRYPEILDQHRAILRTAFRAHDGYEVDTQGDSFFVVFAKASAAVAAAVGAQRALAAHPWPKDATVRVRMGLHTGEPLRTSEGYAGLDVHRAARISAVGHGGQVLLSEATTSLVRQDLPDGVVLDDLGSHRLKDLLQPEQLSQLQIAELATDFPPLRSLNAHPNNLPVQLTAFVGRELALTEVRQLAQRARLLTLSGVGGIGKTRLALQAAAELVDEFPDGVWLVELAPLFDSALVPHAVAAALGLREEPGRSMLETVTSYLRLQRTLLILDTSEHLLAACAELAETLLHACIDLHILVTSRESLNVAGEVVWRVPPFALPDDKGLLQIEELRNVEVMRLFAERAAAVSPGFAVTEQNARAIVEICRQLDGIPLAIELAAARLRVLSPAQILERLADRFRIVTGGSRTALPRHQTLRAAIDWSYNLLNEAEKIVLRRLSVFAGGWSLEAAEAVCAEGVAAYPSSPAGLLEAGASSSSPDLLPQAENGGDSEIDVFEVLDLITGLVDKSLIGVRRQEPEPRYGMLDTIRAYAAEKLAVATEAAIIRGRHRDWYLSLAERAEAELEGPDQAAWLDRLEVEHANLRAALDWSAGAGAAGDRGLRLAASLWRFWQVRGGFGEGTRALERALAGAPDAAPALRAHALNQAAWLARNGGEIDRAAALGRDAVELYRGCGDLRGLGWALTGLGTTERERGNHETAAALWQESLTLLREQDDERLLALALGNAGLAARDVGSYQRALERYTEALGMFRRLGDKDRVAWMLANVANVMVETQEYEGATLLCEEGMALAEELQSRRWLAGIPRLQGTIAREQGDPERSWKLLLLALARHDEINDRQGVAHCLRELAATANACGRPEDAVRLLEVEARTCESAGFALTPAVRQRRERYLADTYAALGRQAFDAIWDASRAMPPEAAISMALGESQTVVARGGRVS